MEICNSTTQPPRSITTEQGLRSSNPWISFWVFFFIKFGIPFLLVCCYYFICLLVTLVGLCLCPKRIGWTKYINGESDMLWVTTASAPLDTHLKSNMSLLKGPKVDQLPNLLKIDKAVGTLEELLIMP